LTSSAVHVARLLGWGRTLARHGALIELERSPKTPPALRRLFRLARFGLRTPARADHPAALRTIGPAAIKLGQALATRPDLVGPAAARDLMTLQDRLPPIPFSLIRREVEDAFGRPLHQLYAAFEETPVGAASVAQVHRARLPDGREVAVKVLRPGIEDEIARATETYEWLAAHLEERGGEFGRLRPRHVIAQFKSWTASELDLRREAASASELRALMEGEPDFLVPRVDWPRTARRVLTIDWVDGLKLGDRDALVAAGHDLPRLARILTRAFLTQAVRHGFFHADLHHGNLFATPDGKIAAIDFGIMGRLHRQARHWLAEILYGLITANYDRVAQIHFEAGYVPPHHNAAEFATALRAVGDPIRGLPVKDISVGGMLDGLFGITRDFEMPTQPHLLLLQKTLVMNEGVVIHLDPDINMWEAAESFLAAWIRDELGPEARLANAIHSGVRTLALLPDLLRRADKLVPKPGAAPPAPPLPVVAIIKPAGLLKPAAIALVSLALGAAGALAFT